MKLQSLLTVNAALALVLGLAFALYSPLMLAFFGLPEVPSDQAILYWNVAAFARMFGFALFAFGLLLWALRSIRLNQAVEPEGMRGILFSLFLANIVGVFVAVTQQWQAWGGWGGWAAAGLFLILALGYAYFLFPRSHNSAGPT